MSKLEPEPSGVFISRGVSLRIPAGGLRISIGRQGPEVHPVTVELSLDMCPFWLEIAIRHLREAEVHHYAMREAAARDLNQELGAALEAEFLAGMQAVVAAVTAVDALYASVKEHANIPAELSDIWRRKGTARYKQVVQTFQRAFRLKRRGVADVHRALREIYRFRDLAVHPPSHYSRPLFHPHARRGTEWRFITFGFMNARQIVWVVLSIVSQLAAKESDGEAEGLGRLREALLSRVEPLRVEWESRHGELTTPPSGDVP